MSESSVKNVKKKLIELFYEHFSPNENLTKMFLEVQAQVASSSEERKMSEEDEQPEPVVAKKATVKPVPSALKFQNPKSSSDESSSESSDDNSSEEDEKRKPFVYRKTPFKCDKLALNLQESSSESSDDSSSEEDEEPRSAVAKETRFKTVQSASKFQNSKSSSDDSSSEEDKEPESVVEKKIAIKPVEPSLKPGSSSKEGIGDENSSVAAAAPIRSAIKRRAAPKTTIKQHVADSSDKRSSVKPVEQKSLLLKRRKLSNEETHNPNLKPGSDDQRVNDKVRTSARNRRAGGGDDGKDIGNVR